MPRRATDSTPSTQLGAAMSAKRGARTQGDVATEAGFLQATWSAIERGQNGPSPATAQKLAAWLGWSLERVFAAAREPATREPATE
jgi:DNA-binding XRE family transcriptional regulator